MQILAPIVLAAGLAKRFQCTWVYLSSTACLLVVAYVFFHGFRWEVVGLSYKGIFFAGVVVFTIFGATRNATLFRKAAARSGCRWRMSINLVALLCVSTVALYISQGHPVSEAIQMSTPLKISRWIVAQGGSSLFINPHRAVKAQLYAMDIVVLNDDKLRANGLLPSKLDKYASYGMEVFAPCEGTVALVGNDEPDQPIGKRDFLNPVGNFVVLHCDNHTVLLAHFSPRSITQQVGSLVEQGEFLGRIGNSGNTTEPHLHIHSVKGLQTNKNVILNTGEPVPLLIDGRFLSKGDIVSHAL